MLKGIKILLKKLYIIVNITITPANIGSKQFKTKSINTMDNTFWKSVLICLLDNLKYFNMNRSKHTPFERQCLWNYTHIIYRNVTLLFKDLKKAGKIMIDDITMNGNIKTWEEIFMQKRIQTETMLWILGNKHSDFRL